MIIYGLLSYLFMGFVYGSEVKKWPPTKKSMFFVLLLLLSPVTFPISVIVMVAGLSGMRW